MTKQRNLRIVVLTTLMILGSWLLLSQTTASAASPDFSINAAPSSAVVIAGAPTDFIVTLTSQGFTGVVSLDVSVPSGATGVTAFANPSTVALTSGGTGTSDLHVSTSMSSPTKTFMITITGTSGSLSHKTSVSLTIVGGILGGSTGQPTSLYQSSVTTGLLIALGSALALAAGLSRRGGVKDHSSLSLEPSR